MREYESDPAWQALYADFRDEHPEQTPTERMLRRIRQAGELFEIERQYATHSLRGGVPPTVPAA